MPTPSSGTISFQDIGNVSLGVSYTGFVTSNVSMPLRGGTYIPNVSMGGNLNVPTTAANIGTNQFYNVWGYRRLSFNLTVGHVYGYPVGKFNFDAHGYSAPYGTAVGQNNFAQYGNGNFGSISANSFVTPRGTFYIVGFSYDTGMSNNFVLSSGATPTDEDQNFIAIGNGYRASQYTRASRDFYYTNSFSAQWEYPISPGWFPTTGTATYSCYVNYYG